MLLVFDVGATHMRIALSNNNELGEPLLLETEPTTAGFAKFLGALQEAAQGHSIEAVLGGFPGQLEGKEGRIVFSNNLPDWVGLEVVLRIQQLFDCAVYITNDVVLCGLGESHFGAGTTTGVMAYFTISTGVNAVRIINGSVDGSIRRYEIGEQLLRAGRKGYETLEDLVGGSALERRSGKEPAEVEARSVWEEIERDLAVGLYNTALHWDPDLIVLGGAMMRDIDLDRVEQRLQKLAQEWPRVARLKRAELGRVAGLNGALAWYKQIQDSGLT